MGVDANLYLSSDIRVDDVIDAIGRMLELEPRRYGDKNEYWTYHGLNMIEVRRYSSLNMLDLTIPTPKRTEVYLNPTWFYGATFYNTDSEGRQDGTVTRGMNCLHFSSSPLRVAILIRLAKTFGGIVEANDSKGIKVTYKRPRRKFWAGRNDGDSYHAYLKYLWDISPLTEKEIQSAKKLTAHKSD